jgi:hypothetical protein
MRTYTVALCFTVLALLGCGKAGAFADVDTAVRTACELLALRQQAVLNVDANRVIATTCAVDAFTRELRDEILRKQIETADKAGVPTVPVTGEQLDAALPDGGT